MFDTYFEIEVKMEGYTVHTIERKAAKPWIMKKHYAKRMPSVAHSYGLFKDMVIVGVCIYGIIANYTEQEAWKPYKLLELSRLVIEPETKNIGSWFISQTFKLLEKPVVLISYADRYKNHIGYIYQATNWYYTGVGAITDRTFVFDDGVSIHSRHSKKIKLRMGEKATIVKSSGKHRYYQFLGFKKQKKEMLSKLRYPILPYPKGESRRYDASAEFPKQVQMFG